MSWSHCHTSVTSDDTVTVMVTSHKITEKDIESSGRMMSYNVCTTCWLLGEYMVI